MDKPLLSVVMPTHNRSEYAISAIKSILSIEGKDIQLVVTDTSESRNLGKFVNKLRDERLCYIHIKEPLSMTENHNAATSLAEGQYVCLIGDDDTITQELITACRWAKKNKIMVLSPLVVANYAWPDFKSKYLGKSHAGRLYIRPKFGRIVLRDSKNNLYKALKRGVLGTEGLPKIYHGIVRKDLLEQIKNRSGAYFHGSSPDVSGAISLAIVSDNFVEIDYPLTLPGASGKSNTGRSALKKHKGTLKDDAHTKRFKNLNWPEVIPKFTSVETVWAQSAYETLQAINPTLLNDFNIYEVYAACLLRHWDYLKEIFCAISTLRNKKSLTTQTIFLKLIRSLVHNTSVSTVKFLYRISKPTAAGGRDFVSNLKNIHAAQMSLSQELENRTISFEKVVHS